MADLTQEQKERLAKVGLRPEVFIKVVKVIVEEEKIRVPVAKCPKCGNCFVVVNESKIGEY